jgi:chromate transporter
MVPLVPLRQLAFSFLKIGALGFGGPFSLLAIMEKEVVERRRWLAPEDFAQSVAMGTITPGPMFFAAAVFVGYRLRGLAGAVVCGAGTLLPSFVLVVVMAALYVQAEQNAWIMAASRSLSAGVVGLLVSVVLRTGRSVVHGWQAAFIVIAIFLALAVLKIDPIVLIVAAGLGGACLLRPAPAPKSGANGAQEE